MSRARPNGRALAIYTQICKTIPLAHEQETVWNADLCFWSWEIFAAARRLYVSCTAAAQERRRIRSGLCSDHEISALGFSEF